MGDRLASWLLVALAPIACVRGGGPDPPAVADEPAAALEPGCRHADPDGLRTCVDVERIADDVRRIAHPRPPGSRHWLSVQRLCAETFADLGYEVEQHHYATGTNVLGTRRGETRPEQRVIVGAHYDHIFGCDGADDNATGVAGVLEVARVLAGRPSDRTLVLACWDEEERGLLGSHAWVQQARAQSQAIVVYFNFDAIGVRRREPGSQRIPPGFEVLFPDEVAALEQREFRGDFVALVTDPAGRPFADALAEHSRRTELANAVLEIGSLVLATPLSLDVRRSDHASFWEAGYPAVMITDTADFRTDTYHCQARPDGFETIDPGFTTDVVRASVAAVAHALDGIPTADRRSDRPHQGPKSP